jgi:hypothetical protein
LIATDSPAAVAESKGGFKNDNYADELKDEVKLVRHKSFALQVTELFSKCTLIVLYTTTAYGTHKQQ